jgi:hypothetical protein
MPDQIKRLTCPAEQADSTIDLESMTKADLVRWIASQLKLRYNEKGDKAFLGATKVAEAPQAPPAAAKPTESDPALIGPKKKPSLKAGDYHIVVNGRDNEMKIFNANKELVKELPVLAKGWNGPTTYSNGGDTPPGLYLLGTLYKWGEHDGDDADTLEVYGDLCWDMEEQENQENERGRAGISMHGGRPGRGRQAYLRVTSGCLRAYNDDLEKYILPLTHEWDEKKRKWVRKGNRVWVSVYQDHV